MRSPRRAPCLGSALRPAPARRCETPGLRAACVVHGRRACGLVRSARSFLRGTSPLKRARWSRRTAALRQPAQQHQLRHVCDRAREPRARSVKAARAARSSSAASGAQPGWYWPGGRCTSTRAARAASGGPARRAQAAPAGRCTRAHAGTTQHAQPTGSSRARLNLNGRRGPPVRARLHGRQVDARQARRTAASSRLREQ